MIKKNCNEIIVRAVIISKNGLRLIISYKVKLDGDDENEEIELTAFLIESLTIFTNEVFN